MIMFDLFFVHPGATYRDKFAAEINRMKNWTMKTLEKPIFDRKTLGTILGIAYLIWSEIFSLPNKIKIGILAQGSFNVRPSQ